MPDPRFLILGILNVTPDSFSDGGTYTEEERVVERAEELLKSGADFVDLGAESTRPGAKAVTDTDEWSRLERPLSALCAKGLGRHLSIDTRWPATALRAAELGVRMFNNVQGLFVDTVLSKLGSYAGARYVAMHMHGKPETMQEHPMNRDLAVHEVPAALSSYEKRLLGCGFSKSNVYLDPGIGFGKTDEANVALLALTGRLSQQHNVAVGVSRKGFVGRMLGIASPADRDAPCKMLELGLVMMGARLVRTHDVASLNRVRRLL